jgi:hypothetical protein
MACKINNRSNHNIEEFEPLVQDMYKFGKKRLGFNKPPVINFVSDDNNHHLLGKTGQYDPNTMEITIYTDNRHPKDMMRSIAHELIHHLQNLNNQFDMNTQTYAGYAQKDPHMRKMEADAYLRGNLLFRDWEDGYKSKNKDIFYERRIRKMSTKKWKNKELNGLLNERWGFSMDLGVLNEQKMPMKKDSDDIDGDGDTDDMVPAFLDKGDVEKPKKSGNAQPPQLAKAQGKDSDNDEDESKKENKDSEESDLEAEILGVLEAEGGAAGMKALEKELDASKDQIRKEIEDSDKMEKHRDGDIIDITGLEGHDDKDEDEDEEEENENLYESWGFSFNLGKLNESKDLEEMRIVATGEDKNAGMKMSDMKPMGTMDMAAKQHPDNLMALLQDVVGKEAPQINIEDLAEKIRMAIGMPPSSPDQPPQQMSPMMEKKVRKAALEALRRIASQKRK